MKVLLTEDITDAGKDYLTDRGYKIKICSQTDEETIIKEVKDCDAILVRTANITDKVIEAGKNLKVIAKHGVGVDSIDINTATRLGIQVTYGPFSNFESVSEHTIALLLACSHNIVQMDKNVRNNNWSKRDKLMMTELKGKVLGVLGLGRIGFSVAKKASLGLEMKVIGYNRHAKKEDLPDYIELADSWDDLFKRSDFVSLHMPTTNETRNSVNMEHFKLMKSSAFLINCARGEIVNESDLYEALKDGIIKGAALDVLTDEPPKKYNPLLSLDNVIFSPHYGAHSKETFDRMGLHAAIGIHEVLSGKKPSWSVNKLK